MCLGADLRPVFLTIMFGIRLTFSLDMAERWQADLCGRGCPRAIRDDETGGAIRLMKNHTGSRWEITVDGKPRSYDHSNQLAIEGALSQAQEPARGCHRSRS
jgi:hypothetical protein